MAFCLFIISYLSPFPGIHLISRFHEKKLITKVEVSKVKNIGTIENIGTVVMVHFCAIYI